MKILVIRKAFNEPADGGDIYNKKLIQGLTGLGNEVTEFSINCCKKGFFPFWRWRVSQEDIQSLRKMQVEFDKIVISHESLGGLTKYIRCDLFIFQNMNSRIRGSFWALQFLYKLGATKHEKKAIANSKRCLVLSYREFLFAESDKVYYCPPGINEAISTNKENSTIFVSSSSGWVLKRKSQLKQREVDNIERYFRVKWGNEFGRVGIIEDRFDCGFKLRLIQMIFNCDLIVTKLDYEVEVEALGCSSKNIFRFSDFSEINFDELVGKIDSGVNQRNRECLLKQHTWREVSKNILKILTDA